MGELADYVGWLAAGGAGLVALVLATYCTPAQTSIMIDTPGSIARAEMRLLWGLGPKWTARLLPREIGGARLALFNDPVRIGHALMTPGLAEAAYEAVRRVYEQKPTVTRVALGINLADTAQNTVVQTAAQAAFASAPAALRERLTIHKCEAPGAEVSVTFELFISPLELNSIWNDFRRSRSAREFRKRLRRKPKPQKKAPREVRAA